MNEQYGDNINYAMAKAGNLKNVLNVLRKSN